jgi:hypothetical protein
VTVKGQNGVRLRKYIENPDDPAIRSLHDGIVRIVRCHPRNFPRGLGSTYKHVLCINSPDLIRAIKLIFEPYGLHDDMMQQLFRPYDDNHWHYTEDGLVSMGYLNNIF